MAKYKKPPKPDAPQQPSTLASAIGIVAGLIGVFVGKYATFALLVPGVTALVIGLTLGAFIQQPRKSFVVAVALQFGHGTWMLVGMFILGVMVPALLAEAFALLLLPWLLLFVPPLIPAIPLMLLHTLGLAVNVLAFVAEPFGTPIHQALLVHIVFRVGAIIGMVHGLVMWYSQPAEDEYERGRDGGDESDVELVAEEEDRPRRRRAEEDDREDGRPRRQERRDDRPPNPRHPNRPYREDDDD